MPPKAELKRDVSQFTSNPPQRSVFTRPFRRAGDYLIERIIKEIPEAEMGEGMTAQFPDLKKYHLLTQISVGMQIQDLWSWWLNRGVVTAANDNPTNPRTGRVVEAWEAVRWTNGLLMAVFEFIELYQSNKLIDRLTAESWFMTHETSGVVGREEDADLGISDNLNLRSHWAADYQDLLGPLPFFCQVRYPERSIPLTRGAASNIEIRWKLRNKWELVQVDMDWSVPPAQAPVNAGDQTAAEITGYFIDELTLDAENNAGAGFLFFTFDVVQLMPSELPRINPMDYSVKPPRPVPYQWLVVSTQQTVETMLARQIRWTYTIEPRFREVFFAFRPKSFIVDPIFMGRRVVIAGTIQLPTYQARTMQRRWHGGNAWFNFSGHHKFGEAFVWATVWRGSNQIYSDVSASYRVSAKSYHQKASEHFLYMWPGSIDPEARDPAGSASEQVKIEFEFSAFFMPTDTDVFIWEKFDNVVEIQPDGTVETFIDITQ